MTWSIVARDSSGAFGVAIASRFFAVGSLCPGILTAKGALSSQALMNPLYRGIVFAALNDGASAGEAVRRALATDEGRESRQLHVIDANGGTAAHTGAQCIGWCGAVTGDGYSVAGNMLAGPDVVKHTARAYEDASFLSFPERLLAAMDAGEAAGGDKRGRQGAALLIHTTEDYPFLDLRVDDHESPLEELRRLHEVSLERFQPFVRCLPKRGDPVGITDRTAIEAEIERFNAGR